MGEKKHAGEGGDRLLGRTEHRPSWVLSLSIAIRAAHQLGAAIFLSAYLLDGGESPKFYTLLAVASGAALVVTEWLRHRQLCREFGGVATIGKCLLLGAAIHGLLPATPTVLLAFLMASMAAHAPKNIRHRLLY
jgi:hypothetical protein